MRAVPVAVGQRFAATVVAQAGDQIWFGYRGAVLQARANRPLMVGQDVEFAVVATAPRIELEVVGAGAPTGSKPGGDLSMGGGALFDLVRSFLARQPASGHDAAMPELRAALQQLSTVGPTGHALEALDRHLGHEHEARLMRAGPALLPAAIAELRGVAKAIGLVQLAVAPTAAGAGTEHEAARALVAGLSGIERDNATRAGFQTPLWLPLPAAPELGLRDARMFLRPAGSGGEGASADAQERPFTIVLLLDLTRLGELRVDVVLRGQDLEATFVAARGSTAALLARTVDELREPLQERGLVAGRLRVQAAADAVLPTADLVPPRRDGSALVDVHA